MNGMDGLKAHLAKLKKEGQDVVGPKKYVKRADIEAARLKRLREEEERERQEKEKRRKVIEPTKPKQTDEKASETNGQEEILPKAEVVRRLRALGQPATLFGEDDVDRFGRLRKAEKDMNVDDEVRGGQGMNSLLELQKQEKLNKGKGERKEKEAKDEAGGEQGNEGEAAEPKDPTLAAFEAAAKRLAEQQAEDQLSIEERISRHLKRWCKEWEQDMDARPEEVKKTGPGTQATRVFKQTMLYFEPLHSRLKRRQVHEELRNGIWMMVKSMRERNYLAAYDVYLKLAIGNAPWPIGVTSVGIHERSAREKISHVMNVNGQAHIMNDEATRKYLQAMKRLITFVQRIHPTDPSRSVDFSTVADAARGAAGGGSDKLALLEAEQTGQDWKSLGLPAAPHFMEKDGTVKVPPKWSNVLSRALESDNPSSLRKTPPATPPATPPHSSTPPQP